MAKKKSGLFIYRDHHGEFRWEAIAKNGRIVAASSEGFKRRTSAVKNMMLVRLAMTRAFSDRSK